MNDNNVHSSADVKAWRQLLLDLEDEYVDECIVNSDLEFVALCMTLNLNGGRLD